MKTNKFITIEGGEGVGKSSFLPIIEEFLKSKNEEYILTKEPGGTELGIHIRNFLLEHKMDTLAETLLMFAARKQHIKDIIEPALRNDKWVICDRFTDSTYAYQSIAKGLPESVIKTLQDLVQKDLRPNLTFVFDVPLEIGKERLNKIGKKLDKFENETDEFKEKVYLGYKNIVKRNPSRCKLIDTSKSFEENKEQILLILKEYYKNNNLT